LHSYNVDIIFLSSETLPLICILNSLTHYLQFSFFLSQTMTIKSLITSELPLSIECMIENALLHSILDTTFEQIKWPWWVPQDDNQFDPLCGLLRIRKLGTLEKDKVT
jgi:hypothetical protein